MPRRLLIAAALATTVSLAGCSSPNQANVELRKENQQLKTKVDELTRRNDQLRSQLRAVESNRTTVDTLPQDRLESLWTVGGIEFGRLTGRTDDGVDVYLTPIDGTGSTLKAAGGIRVEAFDLAGDDPTRLQQWEFPLGDAKNQWQSGALFGGYALRCKWDDNAPADDVDLLVKVTFEDGLTGRSFTATRELK